MVFKVSVVKNFSNFTETNLSVYCWGLLLNKVSNLKTCNFIKKRLKHRSFIEKFLKFFKKTCFTERLRWGIQLEYHPYIHPPYTSVNLKPVITVCFSHFYLKKFKVYYTYSQICVYMYFVFENITIFQQCEQLNHLLTPFRCIHNQERILQFREHRDLDRLGLLYRQNKKFPYLFYRFCVNFTSRINCPIFYIKLVFILPVKNFTS